MAVGSVTETKVAPIRTDELLRVNVGTAPVPAKVKKVKSNDIEVEFKRPICLFDGSNVALSRRIADRWKWRRRGIANCKTKRIIGYRSIRKYGGTEHD